MASWLVDAVPSEDESIFGIARPGTMVHPWDTSSGTASRSRMSIRRVKTQGRLWESFQFITRQVPLVQSFFFLGKNPTGG